MQKRDKFGINLPQFSTSRSQSFPIISRLQFPQRREGTTDWACLKFFSQVMLLLVVPKTKKLTSEEVSEVLMLEMKEH